MGVTISHTLAQTVRDTKATLDNTEGGETLIRPLKNK